jgi:hypothetical protein
MAKPSGRGEWVGESVGVAALNDGQKKRALTRMASGTQAATVQLINAIYEVDFLDCSYGSRPGRDAHQALDEIDRVLLRESITCVLELDIQSYFDSIVRKQLVEMIGRRVSDGSILGGCAEGLRG